MLAEERRDFNLRKLYGKLLRRRSGRDRDRTVERRQKIKHTVNNLDSGRERFLDVTARNPSGKGAPNLAR